MTKGPAWSRERGGRLNLGCARRVMAIGRLQKGRSGRESRKMLLMNLSAGHNGDADRENRLVDSVRLYNLPQSLIANKWQGLSLNPNLTSKCVI